MTRKYPQKRIRAYAFRQFQRTMEKERKEFELKSGRQKEVVVSGYGKIKEQVITYPTRKYSQIVYRDSNGKFTKKPESKVMPKEEKIGKRFFGDMPYQRASVFIEVPYHSNASRGIHNYFWFGIIVIDKPEKIDIDKMHKDLIKMLEKELHYTKGNFWFEYDTPSIEYPKPYPANHPDILYEKWSRTKK
jgi:hypothetical protein